MSTSPLRAAMVPVTRQMRAYFAPVNRASETPTIFDPGSMWRVSTGCSASAVAGFGMDREFRAQLRYADGGGAIGSARRCRRCNFAGRWRREWNLNFGSGASCRWHWRAGRST